MIPVARMGDTCVGTCYAHQTPIPMSGIIQAGSSHVFCDNLLVAVDGDIVIGGCGHVGILSASSAVLEVEGRRAIRIGDTFSGSFVGTVVAGSGVTSSK